MVPAQGSPAINNGDSALIPAGITTDQRGAPRINASAVDIGAVESGQLNIVVTTLADEDDGTIDPALGSGTSLREAIIFVNADPYTDNTISFAVGLKGTIALTKGALPAMSTNLLTIAGPGASVLAVSGQGKSAILSITSGSIAAGAGITISGLTLADGSATNGGALVNAGSLKLIGCALSNNTATNGGGVFNTGSLTLADCTLSGDTASGQGGGIYNYKGALTLANCTLSGNSARFGAAIYDLLATVTLANCTVASNSAFFIGGIDVPLGGSMNLFNTIVAGNTGGDITGTVAGNNNLIEGPYGTGGLTTGVSGNIVGVNPMLGPLAYNGGPTQTMALLPGSPAINAGDSTIPGGTSLVAPYSTDERGAERIKGAAVDLGAFEYGPQIIFVTSLADSGSSGITLRDALDVVGNIDPFGGDTITFAPRLTGTITLSQGMLPSGAANYTIEGPGAMLLTIDARKNSGILAIPSGSIVKLTGLTLTGGSAMYGGAIENSGTLSLGNCTVSGSQAIAQGGGIFNDGALAMVNCTMSDNVAGNGGGIANFDSATLINCTLSGNRAVTTFGFQGDGGGIYNYDSSVLNLYDCTVAGNSAVSGGGLDNIGFGVTMLNNTIVAAFNGSTGGDITGFVTGSNNLIDDASTAGGLTSASANVLGEGAMLGPLGHYGGPIPTIDLLPGSPAVDAGDDALVPPGIVYDQRGILRFNGNAVDIGAFESGTLTLLVTTLADVDDAVSDPLLAGGMSLREAIEFADAAPGGGDTITFSPLLKGAIDLTNGPLPAITADMTIKGPGANVLSINGQGQSRILLVNAGASVTISGLTFSEGNANKGGAIDSAGNLTLTNCELTQNKAGAGGAIFNDRTGVLTMTGSTVSGNTSNDLGAGIFNYGTATLKDCTITGNTGAVLGGGIYNFVRALEIDDSTIAGNSATVGGGIYAPAADEVTLNNTIVANSLSGGDIFSDEIGWIGRNNLIGDGKFDTGLTGTITGNPDLGPLAWNGGPTRTMALLTGSPAIGKGVALSVTADQRGFALDSPLPDIGSFQYQGPPPTASIFAFLQSNPVQVETGFILSANDPTSADQSGTFTYMIDWNGDGSDIQTVKGPNAIEVSHAYSVAGSYTPVVTVIDQDNRSSSPVAVAAPFVVSALTTDALEQAISISPVTISASTVDQALFALQTVNTAPQSTWNGGNSVDLSLSGAVLADPVIAPSSSSAQVTVSGPPNYLPNIANLLNVNQGGNSPDLQAAAEIAVIAAIIAIGAGAGSAGATSGITAAAVDAVWDSYEGEELTELQLYQIRGLATTAAIAAGGNSAQVAAGVSLFVGASVGAGGAGYVAMGASPALVVDQGTVTCSNGLFGTATDSSTIIVNGGTLILENDWVEGTLFGTQPVIEVDGGTLILGAPDGTAPTQLGEFGTTPFVHVTGDSMVIVEAGNTFDQFNTSFTGEAVGSTDVQLVSSAPDAVPGENVTYTATVTAGGAPATDGSVEFFDYTTGTFLGTEAVDKGSAAVSLTLSDLTAGDTIYATDLPTTGALAPSSGKVTQVVANPTQITVSGPSSTPTYGESVTCTATVTNTASGGGTPIGTIEFFDGTMDLGHGSPLSGSGSTATSTFSTETLTAGSHIIQAVFTPGGSFEVGSGFLSVAVNQATPTITWPSPNDIVFGTALSAKQLDATATNPENDETVDGSFAYVPGEATILGAGSDQSLDVTFTPSDTTDYMSPVTFSTSINVTKHSTTTTLAASTPAGAPEETVTFTATVAGGLPAQYLPTGSVQFQINGIRVGSPVPLSASDTAVFSTTEPAAGAFTVSAIYSGDTNFFGSPSSAFTEAVLTPGVFAVGSTLYVVGANTSDNALVLPLGTKLDGSTGLSVVASLNHALVAKTFVQSFTVIDIFGYGGNDHFVLFPTLALPTTVVEGNGNDLITLANGNDTVTLGNGNDQVSAGDGDDNVTVGNGNDVITLGNGSNVIVEGNGNDHVSAGNGADLVVAGLGQHTVLLGNGNNILIDGAATVVRSGDSLRQIVTDWNASASTSVNTRLKVVYNTSHPNVLKAGSGRNWWFFTYQRDVTNIKKTDFHN
jgi:CSLREA domain-containing protein